MIVVKVELWPGGNESKARELRRAYIANVGGTVSRGDYRVHCPLGQSTERDAAWLSGREDRRPSGRSGEVRGYPRKSYSPWRLIVRALRAAFPEE